MRYRIADIVTDITQAYWFFFLFAPVGTFTMGGATIFAPLKERYPNGSIALLMVALIVSANVAIWFGWPLLYALSRSISTAFFCYLSYLCIVASPISTGIIYSAIAVGTAMLALSSLGGKGKMMPFTDNPIGLLNSNRWISSHDDYVTEARTIQNAIRRCFTPVGFLPFALLCLSLPFLRYDDLFAKNPGYAGLRQISNNGDIWAGVAILLIVAGFVAWLMRNLGMQILALIFQSAYFLVIAWAIFTTIPHTLGWAIYGSIGAWGGAYVVRLIRGVLVSGRGGS